MLNFLCRISLEVQLLLQTEDAKRKTIEELKQLEQQALIRTEQVVADQKQTESELTEKQSELQKVKGELKSEKFKGAAADAGTKAANFVGSMFSTSKIERQQQEIEELKTSKAHLEQQLAYRDANIRNLQREHKEEIARMQQSHKLEIATKQSEIDCITRWFPELIQVAQTADFLHRNRVQPRTDS